MDPVSTFGLAVTVLDLVNVSIEIGSQCYEIYQNGRLSDHIDVDAKATSISSACNIVLSSLPEAKDDESSDTIDKQLREFAQRCLSHAHELTEFLERLKPQSKSTWQALKALTRSRRSRQKINRLLGSLQNDLKTLDTVHLARIGNNTALTKLDMSAVLQRLDKISFLQLSSIEKLNTGFKNTLLAIATLQESLQQDHEATRALIRDSATEHAVLQTNEQVLRDLDSPYRANRAEQISPAYEKTFRWAFENDESGYSKWANLATWLRSDERIYWIQGKPGCGKSTFIQYVKEAEQISKALAAWSGGLPLATPAFYFWKAGTHEQKSFVGFARSILYSLLKAFPKLIHPLMSKLAHGIEGPHRSPEWSSGTLKRAINFVARQSIRICFFVDGFDECEIDTEEVFKLMTSLRTLSNVKICLSSRPMNSLLYYLYGAPRLRLQDLTQQDINVYVTEKLRAHPRMQKLEQQIPSQASRIVSTIVDRADGVFLWVQIVVTEVLRGLHNNDTFSQLQARVESFSPEMEGLLSQVASRVEPQYRQDSARLLRLILSARGMEISLLDLILASNDFKGAENAFMEGLKLAYKQAEPQNPVRECFDDMEIYLNARCENFITLEKIDNPRVHNHESGLPERDRINLNPSNDDHELPATPYNYVRVMHRTVRDFFLESTAGKAFLQDHTPASFNVHYSMAGAYCRHIRLIVHADPNAPQLSFKYAHSVFACCVQLYRAGRADPASDTAHLLQGLRESAALLDTTRCIEGANSHRLFTAERPLLSLNCWQTCPCDSSLINRRCEDFITDDLGLCAAMGLSKYVEDRLRSTELRENTEYLTYLLFCTNLGPHSCPRWTDDVKLESPAGLRSCLLGSLALGKSLLTMGADPNDDQKVWRPRRQEMSPWDLFLDQMLRGKYEMRSTDLDVSSRVQTRVLELIRAYQIAGANPERFFDVMRHASGTSHPQGMFICRMNAPRVIQYHIDHSNPSAETNAQRAAILKDIQTAPVFSRCLPREAVIGVRFGDIPSTTDYHILPRVRAGASIISYETLLRRRELESSYILLTPCESLSFTTTYKLILLVCEMHERRKWYLHHSSLFNEINRKLRDLMIRVYYGGDVLHGRCWTKSWSSSALRDPVPLLRMQKAPERALDFSKDENDNIIFKPSTEPRTDNWSTILCWDNVLPGCATLNSELDIDLLSEPVTYALYDEHTLQLAALLDP